MDFYERNAKSYFDSTVDVDMSHLYRLVLPYLKPGAGILDLGCGSGRDARFFKEQGFRVLAADPAQAMCELARAHSGVEVLQISALELDFQNEFDLIWACASLLHVPFGEMPGLWRRIAGALVPGGICFVTLKKGDFEGIRGERWYCDYSLPKLEQSGFRDAGLELIYSGESFDRRPGRGDEVWGNYLLQLTIES
jgi:SAM-dependent methyltransferase